MGKRVSILCILSCVFIASESLYGQPSLANPYRLEWKRDFSVLAGIVPVGASDQEGTLWLIASPGPGKPEELTRIDPNGEVSGTFNPNLPLNPIQWVDYLSPATSGNTVGLLANLVSGGRDQTHEGAYFVPIGVDGLGPPVRVAAQEGPQFPHLIGDGTGQFIAIGDQEPLTLMKLDANGTQQWRQSFSRKLVLPEVAVGPNGNIFMVSQGGRYILLQILDRTGRLLASKRIAAKQGTVSANADGGCTVLLSKRYNGKDNRVYLRRFSQTLREGSEIETPLFAWGRTYQLISTPRGHLAIGEGAESLQHIIAEFDNSGKPIWQQTVPTRYPLLVPFKTGFYIVDGAAESGGTSIEKYLYEN